jgi:hypothetical protein
VAGDPRRLAVADLTARLAAGLTRQTRAYDAAAGQAHGELRQALEDLGRAKQAQFADLTPLARALGVSTPAATSVPPAGAHAGWGVVLGEAFQGERALEVVGRELASLTVDRDIRALAARLAVAAGRDGGRVRKLYLRYS